MARIPLIQKLTSMVHHKETVDPQPVELNAPQPSPQQSLRDEMMMYIRQEVSRIAVQEGHGSFEEEDDFEIDEDDSPLSPHELRYQDTGTPPVEPPPEPSTSPQAVSSPSQEGERPVDPVGGSVAPSGASKVEAKAPAGGHAQ